jgi:hypothetical protein
MFQVCSSGCKRERRRILVQLGSTFIDKWEGALLGVSLRILTEGTHSDPTSQVFRFVIPSLMQKECPPCFVGSRRCRGSPTSGCGGPMVGRLASPHRQRLEAGGVRWLSVEGCRIRVTCGSASLDHKKRCPNVIVQITLPPWLCTLLTR